MKKALIVLVSVVTVLTTVFFSVISTNAETTYREEYYTYTVENGEATIYDCDTSIIGDITLPSTLGGYPVTSISAGAFQFCDKMTKVTIPKGITSIGYAAFFGCYGLKSIVIPSSVNSIGWECFSQCNSLTSITLPDGIEEIGQMMFYYCTSLKEVNIPSSVKRIRRYAFQACFGMTSIEIPEGVCAIECGAFLQCSDLTSIVLPKSITTIEEDAFDYCSGLTTVYYEGTLSEWDKLSIELGNEYLLNATLICKEKEDPHLLTPGSERVIFIRDPDQNGFLEGDGSGKDSNNPLAVKDHELFDESVSYPKHYLQTAFYQATEMLSNTGGTIVICAPIYLGVNQSYGSGETTRDVYTDEFGSKTIKFTSVYDGVDYRTTNGAKITISTPAMIGIKGQSIWENIDIETEGTDRAISFNFYTTLIGEGVNCFPKNQEYNGVANKYVSLSGGSRAIGGVDQITKLAVDSGTYNMIIAGMWGVNNSRRYDESGNITSTNNMDGASITNLELGGDITVLGEISGTSRRASEFSGNVNITINSGYYPCTINAVGETGMLNADGKAKIIVNGGNFEDIWSVCAFPVGHKYYTPSESVLDISGWSGSSGSYYALFEHVTGFTSIVGKFNPSLNGWQYENNIWYYYENGTKVTNDWCKDSIGWCFLDEDGKWVKDAFVQDSTKKWAYITPDGYFYEMTGWIEYKENWYFLELGYRVENGWRLDRTGWCFLGEDGKWVRDAFVQDSTKKWAYITPDGYFYETTSWIEYKGHWYFLELGYRVENDWRLDSRGWCYLGEDGKMLTNEWVKDTTGWCYLDESGYWDGIYYSKPAV